MKLADVLWTAANEVLWDGLGDYDAAPHGVWRFSCDAAASAVAWDDKERVYSFLRSLGCDTEGRHVFEDYESGHERQCVRYLWLLLASHVAEDMDVVL